MKIVKHVIKLWQRQCSKINLLIVMVLAWFMEMTDFRLFLFFGSITGFLAHKS